MVPQSHPLAFFNNEFMPLSEVKLSPLDRGFLFSDSIYEVIKGYSGKLWRMEAHLDRLFSGAEALNIRIPLSKKELNDTARRLIRENNHQDDFIVYIQVTRGSSWPRKHAFPSSCRPNIFMFTKEVKTDPDWGVSAITVPDNRHGLCYIKTTALIPNCVANTKAQEAGAYEAIFVRDGLVTEGTHTNVFCVLDGVIYTHPLANILPGITRKEVLDIAEEHGLPYREEAVPIDIFRRADEIFLTGTTSEVKAVVELDGKPVRNGKPGPVTSRIRELFWKRVKEG